jgi:putative metalloprotease
MIHTRRNLILGASGFAVTGGALAFDLGKLSGAVDAAKDATKAATLTDAEVIAYSKQMAKRLDAENQVAPAGNKYATRLAAITSSAKEDKGLRLNYKVYLVPEVNACAFADGSIRFNSALMDIMTDDELRYVLGHEVGHVQAGHSRKRLQTALATSAAQKGLSASGGKAGIIADSALGDLIASVVRAQHSQGNEREADDYAMGFMSRHKYARNAAVTALEKLAKLSSGGSSWMSTHPSPQSRADRMRKQLA